MANGVVGLHGQSVLGLAANQYRQDHAHARHQNMRVTLVKVMLKNSNVVSYDLVNVSKSNLLMQGCGYHINVPALIVSATMAL